MLRSQGRHTARFGVSFNALWTGQSISLFGDYIAYFTVPRFVVSLSDQATSLTTVYAAETVPTLLFGFFGGVLVDRMNRRRIALYSDFLRAIAFGVLAFLAYTESLGLWTLIAASFVIGSLAASFNSALMSFVPAVVRSGQLALANTRLAISQQIAFTTGPVLGAVILELTNSFAITFAINAATFVVSAASLLLARPQIRQRRSQATGFFDELKSGLKYLWNDPVIRWTVLAGSAANFVVAYLEATLILISQEVLGITADIELGLVFGALGFGGVVGALSASTAIRKLHLGRTFVIGFFIFGAGIFALASQDSLPLVLFSVFVGFVGLPWVNVSLVTIRQIRSPEEMLGRITAASRALAWGSLPLGALVGGYLADHVFGLETLLLAGAIALFMTGALLVLSPVWRTRAE